VEAIAIAINIMTDISTPKLAEYTAAHSLASSHGGSRDLIYIVAVVMIDPDIHEALKSKPEDRTWRENASSAMPSA